MNKLKLYAYSCEHTYFESENDPIPKLIINLNEVKIIYEKYPNESKKLFNFAKKIIHKLFYANDFVFELEKNDLYQKNQKNYEIDLSELFYLELLIKDEPEIINYKYNIDYINEINNKLFNNSKEEDLRDLIGAKIIIDLINNYQNDDNNESEEENGDKLQDLKEKNKDIIKKILDQNDIAKNLEYENNKKYTYDDILEKNVEEIYVDIISLLIKNNYFSDFSKTKNLLEELNFKSIILTKVMVEKIIEILDENNKYLANYEINEINQFKEENINFYFLLIKYILKNSFFIYNIPFLKQNCSNIIKFFKIKAKEKNIFQRETSLIKKIEFITEYYLANIKEELSLINIKNKSEHPIMSSNDSNIENSQENDYKKYIELAKQIFNEVIIILMHDKSQEEKSIYKIKDIKVDVGNSTKSIFDNSKEKTKEEYLNYILTNIEKEKKDKKHTIYKNFELLIDFINDIKDYIAQNELYFKPDIYLHLTNASNNSYDITDTSDKNKDVYNITCTSYFVAEKKENNGKTKKYKFNDFNVLINGIDEEPFGFVHLINELTNRDYKIVETE